MTDRQIIQEAKARLPLPRLMQGLGLGDHAKKSARCPFHEDGNNSFSTWQGVGGAWAWKCHAACGTGDEITMVEKVKEVTRGEAIQLFLRMAENGYVGTGQQAPTKLRKATVSKQTPFEWLYPSQPFELLFVPLIAKARGYSEEFVLWLHRQGLIGVYKNDIAFPVHDGGKVIGCHYNDNETWKYFPTGQGIRPLIVGDVATADYVMAFESQWDAFAVLDQFPHERHRLALIVTRGAGNGKLVKGLVPAGKILYAWKQNDEEKNGRRAGDVWLADVVEAAGVEVRWVVTPPEHKDANDWTRAGSVDLGAAIRAAAVVGAPRPTPRSLDDLLTQVHQFLCDYVVFPLDEQAVAVTLWIAHTWIIEAFTFTPYLGINSPVKRCGKSTLLDCLKLVCKASWPVVTPSPAVLYRKIERDCPTLLWDEVDTVFTASKGDDGREDLRAVLNSGFQRGTKVARCVGADHALAEFSVFCPKALAGIGKLPDTVADRSLPIVLARKSKSDTVAKFRHRDVSARAQDLHDALAAWAQDPSVLPALAAARPEMPSALGDRASDISEPLLAIADLAGGEWSKIARIAVVTLTTGKAAEDDNVPIQLLVACREIFADKRAERLTSRELLDALIEREEDEPWAIWWERDLNSGNTKGPAGRLAKLLKPFEVYPRVFKEDGVTHRGYDLEYFRPAFGRYLPTLEKQHVTK